MITPDELDYEEMEQTVFVGKDESVPACTVRIEYTKAFFAGEVIGEALQHAIAYLSATLCDELNELEKSRS